MPCIRGDAVAKFASKETVNRHAREVSEQVP